MTPTIIHALMLIATLALSFLFSKTPLSQYDLQIGALLFIVLFAAQRVLKIKSRLLESVVYTFIIMLIVNSSGGIASPFFFLIYFLLFSLSLLLEPIIPITVTLALIVFFLLSLPENQSLKNLIPVFSLAFLTPFALFLGEEYVKIKRLENRLGQTQTSTFLFLSLMLKNHLKNILEAAENFMGDHELHEIKRNAGRMEKLIDKFEKTI